MRTPGFKEELARRRRLGVGHVLAGYRQCTVAKFLGVHPSSVSRWMKAYRRGGDGALEGRDPGGRPRKLTRRQERQVLGWFRRSPKSFGFPTELWTAARTAQVIYRKWRIKFHPRYLNQWLAERRVTPQKPRFHARQQDEDEVQLWLREDWPRIKKVRRGEVRIWF
jgi:transposase